MSAANSLACSLLFTCLALVQLQSSLVTFRSSLESFAFQYKDEIRSNPLFRAQFHRMCLATGVDPLACQKGFWSSLLGLGDFYFELGVQIVDVCLSTREKNGGLIEMQEVLSILRAKYKHQQNITLDDMAQSVSKLACLGSGFVVLPVGGTKDLGRNLLKSVPTEFNVDHLAIIQLAAAAATPATTTAAAATGSMAGTTATVSEVALSTSTGADSSTSTAVRKGCIRTSDVRAKLGWSSERISNCVGLLLAEGMLWIDNQAASAEPEYGFPSIALGVQ